LAWRGWWLPVLLWCACLLPLPVAHAQPSLKLEIRGITGVLLENVRAHLSLSKYVHNGSLLPVPLTGGKPVPALPPEPELRGLQRRAGQEIRAALEPYGYYHPAIETSLEQQDGQWIARYQIDPGQPVLVESMQVEVTGEGRELPALVRLAGKLPLRPGQRLVHPLYDAYREKLQRAALDAGYLDARYTRSELRVNPAEHRASAQLVLDTGPRYYFGDVSIEQHILAPAFVSRYVRIHPGEPFSTAQLLKLQLALGDSGYFSQVELDVRRKEARDHRVPVVVHTVPAAHVKYRLGLGYGTDTGPRVSLGADYRRINRRGHGLSTGLKMSPIEQTANLNYNIPIRNLVSDKVVIGAQVDNSTDVANSGNSRSYKLGVSQQVSLGSIQRNLYVNYLHESFTLGTEQDQVDFLIPGIGLSQLRSDNVLFPRRGYSWNVDVHGAPDVVSATRFARIEGSLRGVTPLGAHGRLLGRAQLGAITVADFTSLPASERFFAGGDQSVRGYDYQTLSPVDSSGQPVGGQYLATASLEAEYLFAGNFGAATFIDAGNADDTFPPQLRIGAGVGFRWRSPVGMLRIDLAHPFNDPNNSYRIHISIGPDL
jgi:translocation and assembly module TamA